MNDSSPFGFDERTVKPQEKKNVKFTGNHIIKIDQKKLSSQTKITINSIEIYYPYPPYENQVKYMSKVIEVLETNSLGTLESPTGTGKTLCLLCACLGWLAHKRKTKNFPVQIFYTSRTHSQLSNVMKELAKTCYLPKTAILSSRDNSCVNPEINKSKGTLLSINCKKIKLRCSFFCGVNERSNKYDFEDIEELCKLGKKHRFCPFYLGRNKMKDADIIFMPYNYVFQPEIVDALDINLSRNVIIVDEAHNIQKVCEDGASCTLTEKGLTEMIIELDELYKYLQQNRLFKEESKLKHFDIKDINNEIMILNDVKEYLTNIQGVKHGNVWPEKGKLLSKDEFLEIFFEGSKAHLAQTEINEDCKIKKNDTKYSSISDESIGYHLLFLKNIIEGIAEEFQKNSKLSEMVKILELLESLCEDEKSMENYVFFLCDDLEVGQGNKGIPTTSKTNRVLNAFCFNAGLGFHKVLKENPHSIILTSGTLSPISGMEAELKCKFEVKLENTHVVPKDNVNFSIITSSDFNKEKEKMQFIFDNSNRGKTEILKELGNLILQASKITPGGILIFFSSYTFMNLCYSNWVSNKILSDIAKIKQIFKDQKDSKSNKNLLKNFKESNSSNKKGGILLSVCRGSLSEGLDFSDDLARMVIVVGIPFANLGDDKVKLKRKFLDEYPYSDGEIKLSGSEWYTQDSIRAVNQALGRVIRHINDYGSMIVIDLRYEQMLKKKLFSGWLRDCAKISSFNEESLINLKKFYDDMKNKKEIQISTKNYSRINSYGISVEDEPSSSEKLLLWDDKASQKTNNDKCLAINNIFPKNSVFNFENYTYKNIKSLLSKDNKEENKQKKIGRSVTNYKLDNFPNFLGQKRNTEKSPFIPQVNVDKNNSNVNSFGLTINESEGENDLKGERDYQSTIKRLEKLRDNFSYFQERITEKLEEMKSASNVPKNYVQNSIQNSSQNSTKTCPICYENNRQFSQAKCGHFACDECWNKWLENKLECPICKGKVRKKTLRKL